MEFHERLLIRCLEIIDEQPITIDELTKKLNVQRSTTLNLVRELKLTNNIKMIKIYHKRYVFINDDKNCEQLYNKLKKDNYDIFLIKGEIFFKELRTMINKRYVR